MDELQMVRDQLVAAIATGDAFEDEIERMREHAVLLTRAIQRRKAPLTRSARPAHPQRHAISAPDLAVALQKVFAGTIPDTRKASSAWRAAVPALHSIAPLNLAAIQEAQRCGCESCSSWLSGVASVLMTVTAAQRVQEVELTRGYANQVTVYGAGHRIIGNLGVGGGSSREPSGGPRHAAQSSGHQEHPITEMPHGQSKDAEVWLNQHRSEQTWHVADVHPEILHELVGVLDRMKAAYPEAHARLTTITTDGDWQQHQHAYAYVSNNGREMHLNPAWLGDKATFEAQFHQERANGWQANGEGMTASEQLATHEFGHVVDAEMSATHDAFEPVISRSGIGKVDATFRMMQSAMIGRLTGQVSRYAQHDHWEMFAEAFVMIHSSQRLPGQAGRMIERLRNFLGHAYKRRYPRGSYNDLDSISADERLDATQRLRAVAQDLDVYYS